MRLTHLSLTNFRNFSRLDVDVPAGSVLLVGGNAQGKTSLLEAVFYLAAFDSFHAESDRQLVNFIAARERLAVARITADFARGAETHRLEVRIIQEASNGNGGVTLRKEILLDGVKRKTHEALGQFNAVLFLPQMLRIIEGAPEERRRYLNMALTQVYPAYAAALSEYNRALTQRNALLKQLFERSGDASQLDYWDAQLASSGAQIIHARIRAVLELERHAARAHHELTRSAEVLRLVYQPAYDPQPRPNGQLTLPAPIPIDRSTLTLEFIRSGFHKSLQSLRLEEIARGVTTIGPQRDELRMLSNGVDLGVYGSRGQARTAMLALKLAEVNWMREKTGHTPVLLLDEVLAELDRERRADLLLRLADCEQALLTTTDLDLFSPEFARAARLWQIHAGRLVQASSG